jgi:hypothetical protein
MQNPLQQSVRRAVINVLLAAGCLAFQLLAQVASAATVTSTWTNATSGNWNLDANWTNNPVLGGFPNNGNSGVSTYDAIINATGSSYTVTLAVPITVVNFTLSSTSATVNHTTGIFTATGGMTLSSGTYQLNGGTISNSAINISGGTLAFANNSSNVLAGDAINGLLNLNTTGARVRLENGTTLTGTANLTAASTILDLNYTGAINTAMTVNLDTDTQFVGTAHLSVDGTNTLTTGSNVLIRGQGSIGDQLIASGSNALINQGTIRADFVSRTLSIVSGTFINQGTLEAINGSTVAVPGGYTQTSGTTRVNGSTISVSNTNKLITIVSGRLEGNGTIAARVANSGTISPGLSAGRLDITNDLTLGSTSNIKIELSGTTQSTQYDLLTEAGTVALNLNGTLSVSFLNNFGGLVQPGDTFTILTSNQTISGAFSNVIGSRVATTDGLGSFLVSVSGNNVTLSAFQVPEPSSLGLLAAGAGAALMRKWKNSRRNPQRGAH